MWYYKNSIVVSRVPDFPKLSNKMDYSQVNLTTNQEITLPVQYKLLEFKYRHL